MALELPRAPVRAPLSQVYKVFAQAVADALPLAALARNAEMHFDAMITVAETTAEPGAERVALLFGGAGPPDEFVIRIRPNTPVDVAFAEEAERRGDAAGMGNLAARCRTIWQVEAASSSPSWAIWECCALLALTALGPILPPDHSTLLGVSSARKRAARLRNGS
jgi:hypothetical protein